jgi:hypothetical protein
MYLLDFTHISNKFTVPETKYSKKSRLYIYTYMSYIFGFTRSFIYMYMYKYTGCPWRNVKSFGRVFLMLNYTDITYNTYIQI